MSADMLAFEEKAKKLKERMRKDEKVDLRCIDFLGEVVKDLMRACDRLERAGDKFQNNDDFLYVQSNVLMTTVDVMDCLNYLRSQYLKQQ